MVRNLLLVLAVGALTFAPPAAAKGEAAQREDCSSGQQTSAEFVGSNGLTISGGKCIPGERVSGDAVCAYEYTKLCQANIPDACAPRPCAVAGVPQPAVLFGVTRITLATGEREERGGGCYSIKDEPPVITPNDVRDALKTIVIPKATISVQPPGGRTLVNLKTIVSSDSAPYERDVQVVGQSVRVWLRPVAWTWDFGDRSAPVVRSDRGAPWRSGVGTDQITEDEFTFHVYAAADPVVVTLTVTWQADYQAPGEQPRAVPGSLDIASPGVPLEILEATPQLVLG